MTAEPDGIIDTSVVISFEALDPSTLPIFPAITSITLAELSAGPLLATSEPERAARQIRLQTAEACFDPIPFDQAAARSFGLVSSSLRSSGRKTRARTYDALISAIALSRGLPVYTLNPDGFTGIDGLIVRAPRELEILPADPDTEG